MITIGATAQEVIMDVHSHIIPPPYLAYLERHDALLDEGVPLPQWNVGDQLKWMDETGVQTSVLTLAAPHPYFGDAAENARLIRQTNEAAAKLKAAYPDRFKFCAALPLPDVNAAIEETTYALDVLKADSIKLATNACGQYLGAPELDTLFSVLHQRNAIVILHPHKPDPVNKEVMCQTPLAMQEYLSETTRAVSNLISRNVPARYPNIRIVVPHCGAYLPLAVPRMKSLAPVMRQNGMIGETDWEKKPRRTLLRPGRRPLTRNRPDAAHHHHARPPALRLRLPIRRSAASHVEPRANETVSRRRTRPGTIPQDDPGVQHSLAVR